jgi:hypothetical protein
VLDAQERPPRTAGTRLRSAARHAGTLFFDLYERIDRRLARVPADPLDPVDVAPLFEGVERVPVRTLRNGSVHRFRDEELRPIVARDLDVLVRFGFGILRGEVLLAARFGVWSHHHGDSRRYRGLPPCFWEIREGAPESGATLQRLGEVLDGGAVLGRVLVPTDAGSLHRNRARVYRASTALLPSALALLRRSGWEAVAAQPCFAEAPSPSARVYRRPNNVETAGFLLQRVARRLGLTRRPGRPD